MSEIKLNMRYPESRLEDITDAYMRGFEFGRAMRAGATDQSEIEQSIVDLWAAVSDLKVWVDAHKNGITQEDFYARQFVYWAVNKEPLERLDVLERRIKRIERLLSHKTGKLAGNDLGAVFLDELGQEEQGGSDELADD